MKMWQKFTVGAAAIGLAGGGVAYASIPDDAGLYHACVKNSADSNGNGHMVRVLDSASESCSSGWTEKTWPSEGGLHGLVHVSYDQNYTSSSYPIFHQLVCPEGKVVVSVVAAIVNASGPPLSDGNTEMVPVAWSSGSDVFGEASAYIRINEDPFPNTADEQVHARILCGEGGF